MTYRAEDWKPGDVAMVKGAWARGFSWAEAAVKVLNGWQALRSGAFILNGDAVSTRRLVVIDAENDEQVEAFRRHLRRLGILPGDKVEDWQAALRAFANPKPPKPEEPTGLGAVVRDRDGCIQTRVITGVSEDYPWMGPGMSWSAWTDIDAVEVLSQGVTPDA